MGFKLSSVGKFSRGSGSVWVCFSLRQTFLVSPSPPCIWTTSLNMTDDRRFRGLFGPPSINGIGSKFVLTMRLVFDIFDSIIVGLRWCSYGSSIGALFDPVLLIIVSDGSIVRSIISLSSTMIECNSFFCLFRLFLWLIKFKFFGLERCFWRRYFL